MPCYCCLLVSWYSERAGEGIESGIGSQFPTIGLDHFVGETRKAKVGKYEATGDRDIEVRCRRHRAGDAGSVLRVVFLRFLPARVISSYTSFFPYLRSTVREMMTFFDKTICKRTPPGQRQSVQNQEYFVHVYMRADGLCGCVTCDAEYPPRVAFSILSKVLEEFDAQNPTWKAEKRNEAIVWAPLDATVQRYQDPANADQIMKIQKNLDETRDVLHNTIETVLARGEKLEDLVERSSELSAQSKLFYTQAKRTNSCCAVV